MKALLDCQRSSQETYRPIMGSDGKPVKDANKTKPVSIGQPVSLRLDWWVDELAGQLTAFKLWGAHLTSERLINDMAHAIRLNEITEGTLLHSPVGLTSRIGMDTRSSWNTLDEGFSPNDQNLPVDSYPASELLAAIGLQTFRPKPFGDGYVYACWSAPLPTLVARAVAACSINFPGTARYRFGIGARGKFKFLTKALLTERNYHA